MPKSHSSPSGAPHMRVWQTREQAEKLKSPSRCHQCGVFYNEGRWQWHAEKMPHEHEAICPACAQINQHQATGILSLSGDYFERHRDEILQLIRHQVDEEVTQHPLNRIIAIERQSDATVISFTDMHLPKRIGHALERAHAGHSSIQYDEDICRAQWQR